MQNVTLALPEELLREAKHLAVDQGVSLSRFVALLLAERVEGFRRYNQAKERQRAMLTRGLSLETRGQVTWKRDELHER
jgi:hypothetical protein